MPLPRIRAKWHLWSDLYLSNSNNFPLSTNFSLLNHLIWYNWTGLFIFLQDLVGTLVSQFFFREKNCLPVFCWKMYICLYSGYLFDFPSYKSSYTSGSISSCFSSYFPDSVLRSYWFYENACGCNHFSFNDEKLVIGSVRAGKVLRDDFKL